MRLYIPTLGDQLKLTADWRFDIIQDKRNAAILEHMGHKDDVDYHINLPYAVVYNKRAVKPPKRVGFLIAGTVLQVERIYIRKDQSDFDSMTFIVPDQYVMIDNKTYEYPRDPRYGDYPDYSKSPIVTTVKPKKRPMRFFVNLDDANNIEFDKV